MDYAQYHALLRVNKHALDDALEVHAQYQADISAAVARLNTQQAEDKEQLAVVEARIYQDLRSSGEKVTAEESKASITRHPDRRAAWKIYQKSREEYEKWLGLLSAWQQKGYSLKTAADLFSSDYFAVRSIATESPAGIRNDDLRNRLRQATGNPVSERTRTRVRAV